MGRKPFCEKTGLKKGKWSAEEDEKLKNYIKANGEGSYSWRSVPHNAGLLRCWRSCRLRWMNYLREDVKRGNFTEDEEETIVKLHKTLGNRWSLIARNLPGRTDNEIKNYWTSNLSRRIFDSVGESDSIIKILSTHKKRGGRFHGAVARKYNSNSSSSNNNDDDNNRNIAADLPLTTSETSIFDEWTTPKETETETETCVTYDEFDLDVVIDYEREKEIINIENDIYQNDERDCRNIDWDLRGNVEDLNLWGEEEDMLFWSYLV